MGADKLYRELRLLKMYASPRLYGGVMEVDGMKVAHFSKALFTCSITADQLFCED